MRTIILVLLIYGGFYYWDKGLGAFVIGNYYHAESKTLRWMKENTP